MRGRPRTGTGSNNDVELLLGTRATRTAGADVTVLEHPELPLLKVLGREAAEVFAALHPDHGVELLPNSEVESTGTDVNVWDVVDPIRTLITSGADVGDELLADPGVPWNASCPGTTGDDAHTPNRSPGTGTLSQMSRRPGRNW